MRNLTGDLLVTGGQVLTDPDTAPHARDIAFASGRISAVEDELPKDGYSEVLRLPSDVTIVPGLIDLHGHYYSLGHPRSVHPDVGCLPNGVTTTADAGTCGWAGFPGLRRHVIDASQTRVYAFLNLSSVGLLPPAASGVGELMDFGYIQRDETVNCLRGNPDVLVGLKVRMSGEALPPRSSEWVLEQALDIASEADVPLMLHISGSPLPMRAVLNALRPGDIVTHCYNGVVGSTILENGKPLEEAVAAQSRGIVFDVGHAGKHFDRDVAKKAIAGGLLPNTVSTDLHLPLPGHRSPTIIEVANELLDLGMSLPAIIEGMTINPAKILRIREPKLGSLDVGAPGDAALLRIDTSATRPISVYGVVAGGALAFAGG